MVPPPSGLHQMIVDGLLALFRAYAASHGLGILLSNHGVAESGQKSTNYRVPEWIFLRKDREHLLRLEDNCIADPPDVVLEVRSPGDETDEKLPFYAQVGVREVLVVDRDSRLPELFRLSRGNLKPVSPDADGWVPCDALKARFKSGPRVKGKPVLLVRLDLDDTTHEV